MPAYRVSGKGSVSALSPLAPRIVIAASAAQAVSFIADALLACENLGAQEVAELVALGVPVVDARRPPASSKPLDIPSSYSGDFGAGPPIGEMREMFSHKVGCLADPWTPIGGKGCKCTSLEMPATGEGIAS
jgi:hypothetical protein